MADNPYVLKLSCNEVAGDYMQVSYGTESKLFQFAIYDAARNGLEVQFILKPKNAAKIATFLKEAPMIHLLLKEEE